MQMSTESLHPYSPPTKRAYRGVRVLIVTTLLLLTASLLAVSLVGAAQAYTPAIDKAKSEVRALAELVARLDAELGAVAEDYNYANQQLEDTKAAVKKTTAELARAEQDLLSVQYQLGQRLVSIYKSGRPNMLSVILNSSSFTGLITRWTCSTALATRTPNCSTRWSCTAPGWRLDGPSWMPNWYNRPPMPTRPQLPRRRCSSS
ncbi:MAG: hypothetical protein JW990_17915 [Thermoleophilia bacterium]|nr:hypothetical protein [Thermoleophilia bacterium]